MARTRGGLVIPRGSVCTRGRSICTRGGFIRTHGGLSFQVSPSQGTSSPHTEDAGISSPHTQDAGSTASSPIERPSSKTVSKKRTRGRTTLMNSFQNLPNGAKHEIVLNKDGQPAFGPVTKLSNAIGIEARTIPVTYMSWNNVPDSFKESLYRRILERFSFQGGDCVEWVLVTANGAWKREKKNIRDERVVGRSLDDALRNMPLGYEKNAWRNTCVVWQSEKYKAKCKTAKFSRSHLELSHSLGSTSIAFVKAKTGQKGMALFELVHSKDGVATNSVVSNVIKSVDNSTSNLPPTCTDEERASARDEALLNVVRRKKHGGRVWGWGKGVTHTSLRHTSAESSSCATSTIDMSSIEKFMNDFNEKENERQAKFEEMEEREKIREYKYQEMEERDKIREAQFQEMTNRVKFLESLLVISGYHPSPELPFGKGIDVGSCSRKK